MGIDARRSDPCKRGISGGFAVIFNGNAISRLYNFYPSHYQKPK
jgi:hypothetical protein